MPGQALRRGMVESLGPLQKKIREPKGTLEASGPVKVSHGKKFGHIFEVQVRNFEPKTG